MSTPHQRLHIRTLLYERDISTGSVSADFRRYCEAAGVPDAPLLREGAALDPLLQALTRDQANRVVRELLTEEGVA